MGENFHGLWNFLLIRRDIIRGCFSRKIKSFMIIFRRGCKFVGEGYPQLP